MKKILLISIALIPLLKGTALAQITITQSNMPYIGSGAIVANDTLSTISPGSGGANQTWNFGSLLNQWQDTIIFTNPNWLPGASSFPSSNLGFVQNNANGSPSYGFISSSASAFDFDGWYADFLGTGYITIKYQPGLRILNLPASYQTSWNATSTSSAAFPFPNPPLDSVMGKEIQYSINMIDGWGTIITPVGSYNSIRQFERDSTIDSIFVHIPPPLGPGWVFYQTSTSVDTTYRWWSNSINYIVAEFSSNGKGGWNHQYYLSAITGVYEPSASSAISVFPNPNNGKFQCSLLNNKQTIKEIKIYNLLGEVVYRSPNSETLMPNTIDISSQAEGIYFLQVKTEEGSDVKKIIIQK